MSAASRSSARLPEWARSIRFRLTLLYSAVLFTLAVLLMGALYLGLSLSLRHEPVSQQSAIRLRLPGEQGEVPLVDVRQFERKVNEHTLENLRMFSFGALGVLFVASLGVGWVIAGRVLSPIARITAVANEIQASNLARRIELAGPDDELKRLADTFDSMLGRLEEAFVAQRRFVADASHELRNPLAIIRTNLDLALAEADATTESTSQAAEVIKRTIARMTRLTDDLLALASLERPDQVRQQVELRELIGEAGEDFRATAEVRGLRIEAVAAGGVSVLSDRDLLKRALANLLDNAVRLAPENSCIRLGAGREDGWVWLGVSDEGPGIAPEERDRIFARFRRLDEDRSRARGGSGLGLAIVRQIAEWHGGQARVFSTPGRGSSFVLWLPVADEAGEVPAFDPTAAVTARAR